MILWWALVLSVSAVFIQFSTITLICKHTHTQKRNTSFTSEKLCRNILFSSPYELITKPPTWIETKPQKPYNQFSCEFRWCWVVVRCKMSNIIHINHTYSNAKSRLSYGFAVYIRHEMLFCMKHFRNYTICNTLFYEQFSKLHFVNCMQMLINKLSIFCRIKSFWFVSICSISEYLNRCESHKIQLKHRF